MTDTEGHWKGTSPTHEVVMTVESRLLLLKEPYSVSKKKQKQMIDFVSTIFVMDLSGLVFSWAFILENYTRS